MSYYENNRDYMLRLKPKSYFSIPLVIFILLTYLLIFSISYKVINYKNGKLIVLCQDKNCQYYFYSSLEDVKDILKANEILIDKNNYPYSVKNVGSLEVDETSKRNYQLIELDFSLPKKYQQNNLCLDVKIKGKEERLIKKISKILFEGV